MEGSRRNPIFVSSPLTVTMFFLLASVIWIPEGVSGVEARMESQFERCCSLGASWAAEGLRCEKFIGPVNGVPRVEQGLCLEAVDICCVRRYHEKSCEKGKEDARAGLACVQGEKSKGSPCPEDQHRDCCEGCKLGILTGSMGQGCALRSFTFGKPWDPAFMECCHEALSTTTNSDTSSTPIFTTDTTSKFNSTTTSTFSSFSSDSTSDSTFPEIPTPGLDDLCQLMRGLLCSDICVPTPGSFYCECPEDSILLEDGKTCRQKIPEDRCKKNNPCSQRCTDTETEIKCSCNPGFVLGEDKRTCSAISGRLGEPTGENNELDPRCPAGYEYNKIAQVCDDIDECKDNPCPGVCKNVVGSFACLSGSKSNEEWSEEDCPPGYQWDPIAQLCTDIDECMELTGACSEDTHLCVNTQGSFTCHELIGPKTCPAGFKFDLAAKICRDVDECSEGIHGCLPEVEQCKNIEGGYECEMKCQKGFAYDHRLGSCLDVDECTETLRPCPDRDTRCVNKIGSYECKNIDEVISNDGNNFMNEKNRSSDECRGENGENECSSRRETNSIDVGRDNSSRKTMRAEEGRREPDVASSDYQEFPIDDKDYFYTVTKKENVLEDETFPKNCPLHAFYNRDKKSCQCFGGFEIDPINGMCRDPLTNSTRARMEIQGNPEEACQLGYRRKGVNCEDIDECLDGPGCQVEEKCENLAGGYKCTPLCSDGWRYDSSTRGCIDVDECLESLDDCPRDTHRCSNDNGTYSCEELKSCNRGYRRIYNGSCVDIDECVEGPGCREHERCKNLPGRYDCEPLCVKGWRFEPSTKGCLDVDECLLGLHDCPQTTHRCVNTNGTYNCQLIPPCTSGFRKLFNGSCVDIDECLENLHDCSLNYHRYCVNREGTYECVTRYPECSKGYEYSLRSRNCQDIDECTRGDYRCDSRFNEKCVNLPGSYRCERPITSAPGKRQKPACPVGYRYDTDRRQCTDVDECTEGLHSCGNEVCYNQPGGYSCARAPAPIRPTVEEKQTGENCRKGTRFVRNRGCLDIDECQEDEETCSSNEQCRNTPGSFACDCKLGFRRDNFTGACVDINECQLLENDCLPTQRCDNTVGSYTCVRHLPCGTGYTLNAATENCEDDDECVLGTHDCTNGYHCRNTPGSYRCDKNSRSSVTQRTTSTPRPLITPRTSAVTAGPVATTPLPLSHAPYTLDPRAICPYGFFRGPNGQCMDIDECAEPQNPCARSHLQKCINTHGSYRCVSRVLCGNGYTLDPTSNARCIDINECEDGTHECGRGQTCQNRQGGYACQCPPGHVVGPNRDCIDIDECSIYSNVCGSNSRCDNTVGSFRCICDSGFENVDIAHRSGVCQDIDECARTPGLCQHDCINVWGSYRCSCRPGFRLNSDNRSCTDIDECVEFRENNLCIGICENTPGSYACRCPNGYKLGADDRICQDIDECASGEVCRDPSEMCQNTRGSFRCNRIDCPNGYYRDRERKNRCVRTSRYCPSGDLECFRAPSHYSYNFITFVSMLPIPSTGILELFTMRGTHLPGSTVQFTMTFGEVRAPPGVTKATESCFALRRPAPSQAVLVMTRSIAGPQEIELNLRMEIHHNTAFAGSAVAKLFIFVSQYEF